MSAFSFLGFPDINLKCINGICLSNLFIFVYLICKEIKKKKKKDDDCFFKKVSHY